MARGVAALLLAALLPHWCSGLAVPAAASSSAALAAEPSPEIVLPGQWLTNEEDNYLFLTLAVPKDIDPKACKVLTNGGTLLVIVTEAPQEEPEDAALKKYKLVMEALKSEAGHDEQLLTQKLQTWLETEDDDEVVVRVRAALDSLTQVRAAKRNDTPRTLSVPLGVLDQGVSKVRAAAPVALLQGAPQDDHALPALARRSANAAAGREASRIGIIKESFAVEIPYPVDVNSIFMIKAEPALMLVGMPLHRNSLEAQGLSTGEKPYTRVPLFSPQGARLAGPPAQLQQLAQGLNVPAVAARSGLRPLA